MDWFEELRRKRLVWLSAVRENDFERGIRQASVEKYPDPAHFLLELLQNAEDQGARKASLRVEAERVVFEHDGSPFTRLDVENITGLGNTAKPTQANKIGCFGIGFKSVFIATDRPEIYAHLDGRAFNFAIDDLVLPTLIDGDESRRGITRFVLPLKADVRKAIAQSSRHLLIESGPRLLLFLQSIERLDWVCGPFAAAYTREAEADGAVLVRSVSVSGDVEQQTLRYLSFGKSVDVGHPGTKEVTVAFLLGDKGELIREPVRSRLFVYFETQEETGLYFLVHGPFLLTDNRANIKRDNQENERIVNAIASLLPEALNSIRDRGLLKRSVLAVMPNPDDALRTPWARIGESVLKAFSSKPLVPTASGGHEYARNLRRSPASLRAAIDDAALSMFCGTTDVSWAVAALRNTREDKLLAALGIAEWTVEDLVQALLTGLRRGLEQDVGQWLAALSDANLQLLYVALNEASFRSRQLLASLPIVRTERGDHVLAGDSYFPPERSRLDKLDAVELALVRGTVLAGPPERAGGVRDFLRSIGVREVDEQEYIKAILEQFYTAGDHRVSKRQHEEHIKRFVALWRKGQQGDVFREARFLLSNSNMLTSARRLYLDLPYKNTGLSCVYGSRGVLPGALSPLSTRYAGLGIDGFEEFAIAVGVAARIPIRARPIPADHPDARKLFSGDPPSSVLGIGKNSDFYIRGASTLLSAKDINVSLCVWNTLREAPRSRLHAVYQAWRAEPQVAPSTLCIALKEHAWISDRDGRFRKPEDMTYAELAPEFEVSGESEWLDAIGFAARERERSEERRDKAEAARRIGLPDSLAEELISLPEADRAEVFIEMAALLRQHRLQQITAGVPEFPERESPDPERRAQRLVEQAKQLPRKVFESKQRQLRKRDVAVDERTRTYLRDLYTNDQGQLICQVCQQEMPFRLPNGEHYFEAVECVPSFDYECWPNHLALCPTCAAKYLYANGSDFDALMSAITTTNDLILAVVLAGAPCSVRFVRDHQSDLAVVLKSAS